MPELINSYLYTFEVKQVDDVAGQINAIAAAAEKAAAGFDAMARAMESVNTKMSRLSSILTGVAGSIDAVNKSSDKAQAAQVARASQAAAATPIVQAATASQAAAQIAGIQPLLGTATGGYVWPYNYPSAQTGIPGEQALMGFPGMIAAQGKYYGYDWAQANMAANIPFPSSRQPTVNMDLLRSRIGEGYPFQQYYGFGQQERQGIQQLERQEKALASWKATHAKVESGELGAYGLPKEEPTTGGKSGGIFGERLGRRMQFMAEWFVFYEGMQMISRAVSEWAKVQGELDIALADFSYQVSDSDVAARKYLSTVMEISRQTAIKPSEIYQGVLAQARVPSSPTDIAVLGAQVQRVTGYDNAKAQRELLGLKLQFPDKTTVEILDAFTGALSRSTLTAGEFFEMLATAGPLAKQFNASMEEVLGMFAGISTATGESNRSIELFMRQMDRVYNDADTRAAVEKYVGPVQTYNPATGEMDRRNLYDIFKQLSQQSQSAIMEVANTIPNQLGQQTRPLFIAMMQGFDNVSTAADAAKQSVGLFADAVDERMTTLPAKIDAVGAAWERLLTTIGGSELPKKFLGDLATWLDELAMEVGSVPGDQEKVTLRRAEANLNEFRINAAKEGKPWGPEEEATAQRLLWPLQQNYYRATRYWQPQQQMRPDTSLQLRDEAYWDFINGPPIPSAQWTQPKTPSNWVNPYQAPAPSVFGPPMISYAQKGFPEMYLETKDTEAIKVQKGTTRAELQDLARDLLSRQTAQYIERAKETGPAPTWEAAQKAVLEGGIQVWHKMEDETGAFVDVVWGYAIQLQQAANMIRDIQISYINLPEGTTWGMATASFETSKAMRKEQLLAAGVTLSPEQEAILMGPQGQVYKGKAEPEVLGPTLSDTNKYLSTVSSNSSQQVSLLKSINSSMRGFVESLLAPTAVTAEDMARTKVGLYENKWDEPVRRIQAAVDQRQTMRGPSEWDDFARAWGVDLSSPESAIATGEAVKKKYLTGQMGPAVYEEWAKGPVVEGAKRKLSEMEGTKALTNQAMGWLKEAGITGPLAQYYAREASGDISPLEKMLTGGKDPESIKKDLGGVGEVVTSGLGAEQQGKNMGESMASTMVPAMVQKLKDMKAIDMIAGAIDPKVESVNKMGYAFGIHMMTGTSNAFKDKFITTIVLAVLAAMNPKSANPPR